MELETQDDLDRVTPEGWEALLQRVFRRISSAPGCVPVLADIGRIRFQLLLTDREELSYWEDYTGAEVRARLGRIADPTVQAATTFPVLVGTLTRRISLMEATAEEAYELRGDTAALMRLANLLPYIMLAFSAEVETGDAAGGSA